MVQYIYEKFNSTFNSGYYYASQTSSNNYPAGSSYSFSGYSGYSIVNGNFVGSGSAAYAWPTSGSVYNGSGSSFSQTSTSGGTTTITNYSIYYSGSYYSKGSRIGQVFAEDGTLPANGQHSDGYYYERKYPASPPTVLTPNGGEVWNNMQTITWSNSQAGLKYKVEISKNNGQSWSTILAESAVDATSYSHNFLNESQSNLAKIRVTGINNGLLTMSDESNGVFTIQHNVAPTIPTLIEPVGVKKNVENIIRFVWKHNDTDSQSKAEIRIREQGTTVWLEENTITGSAQEAYALVDAGIAPTNVEWQVRTYDQQNLVSPWSNIAVFEVAFATDEPVIISPIGTVSTSRPVIQWTSPAQTSYQLVITDVDNIVLWDTGEVVSTIKSRTSGIDFVNGATYRINVRSKDASGIFSDYAQSEVVTSYTPPAKPIVTTYTNETSIVIDWESPVPTGTEPLVLSNDIYKLVDDVWLRIAVNAARPFEDMTATSGKQETYMVQANGDNSTSSVSLAIMGTLNLESPVLSSTYDSELYMILKHMTATAKQKSRGRTLTQFAGRSRALAEFGESEIEGYSFGWISLDRAEVEEFYRLIDRRETLLYRDAEGRKNYVSIDSTNESECPGGAVVNFSFNADVVSYREGV